jgi:concentrative nucleoside transporter, CNT family
MALKMVSLLGMASMIGLAWLCSMDRKNIPWRTVFWGLLLQLIFAVIILKTALGRALFDLAQSGVSALNSFAMEGGQMVFGPLARPDLLGQQFGPDNAFILAIAISAPIILISALSALLYHWGLLQRVVRGAALVMQKTMRTSGSESLSAAANIFMGHTEAPLLIRPYIAGMTRSELLAMMVGGMATIAGGVLAVYVLLGANSGHLVTASVMSAPAALLIAKIILPERETSQTAHTAPLRFERTAQNSIDALCRGASDGLKLALNVLAMLIAFVALVALANALLGLALRPLGVAWTFQQIVGWINAPFAWLMGVPLKDCAVVGQALGERIVLNEFFGYLTITREQAGLDPRSVTIATYALCGFANFGSIAIQIGGIGVLAPEQRANMAQLGVRAMIGGLLSCYLTASLVGVLI